MSTLHRVGLTDFTDSLDILSTSQLRSIDSEVLSEIDSLLLDLNQPGTSCFDDANDQLPTSQSQPVFFAPLSGDATTLGQPVCGDVTTQSHSVFLVPVYSNLRAPSHPVCGNLTAQSQPVFPEPVYNEMATLNQPIYSEPTSLSQNVFLVPVYSDPTTPSPSQPVYCDLTTPGPSQPVCSDLTTCRLRNEKLWKRNVRKCLKNRGKAYVSSSGKTVSERQIGNGCGVKCRLQCHESFSRDTRQETFEKFWSIGDVNQQRVYYRSCTSQMFQEKSNSLFL